MRLIFTLIILTMLTACGSTKYTVDDGRKVDEELLKRIHVYGRGEQSLRPAIVRSSELKDSECSSLWELPFSVATSYDESENDRVAWVRALGVDERLTVVGTSTRSPLQLRDKIKQISNFVGESPEKMLLHLAELRDTGLPFEVTLSTDKRIKIVPFKVCRGLTRLAPPNTPEAQDYHWMLTIHPLQVVDTELSEDEALWLVLWAQGVSEEGGARMKTFHYGSKIVGTLYNLFTIASGVRGAALAVDAARSAASKVATQVVRDQLISQAKSAGLAKLRSELTDAAKKLTQQQVMSAMQQAAANRGSLSGVAWVASTIFDRADTWAYNRLEKLGANPLSTFTLHQKLIEKGYTANSMVFDSERLNSLNKIAEAHGQSNEVVAILQGIKPQELQFDVTDMPLASAQNTFAYNDINDTQMASQPFARGLIDGMLNMPVTSSTSK
jgi:hypothetical protein